MLGVLPQIGTLPMKTLTEFFGTALKTARKAKEDLTAAGKTLEELPAALGEALKIEGDKLKHLMGAIEAVGSKWDDLKRVVVSTLNEGEKAPAQAQAIGETYYTVEHYPPVAKSGGRPGPSDQRNSKGRGGKGGRGGRDGGRGGRGGRDGGREGGGRPPRGPRSAEGTNPKSDNSTT